MSLWLRALRQAMADCTYDGGAGRGGNFAGAAIKEDCEEAQVFLVSAF